MACFLVPVAEAIATTAASHVLKNKEEQQKTASLSIPFSRKLKWLSNFEHVWHGEVTPWFPFLTAAGNPEDAAVMLQELGTAGVGMALLVTAVWLGMVAVSAAAEKKALAAAE